MKITRDGREFTVIDDPETRKWNFWEEQFACDWERGTLAALDDNLDRDHDYLDIGAWVGPTVLWGAPLARSCIAVEPDPVALGVLRRNVERNCNNVRIVSAAVSDTCGSVVLETGGSWGDSMSSMQRRNPDARTVTVCSVTLESLVRDLDLALVKIDIEGGEERLLPPNEELLHDLGCPIVLGVHWPWITDRAAVQRILDGFDVTELDADENYPTMVLR